MTECIYLIGTPACTLVKIGRSLDVEARLAALQAGSPVPLTLLWQTLGGAELESALHRRFDSRRRHGEWFDFPDGDAVACVMQELPGIAAELQRIQRDSAYRRARKSVIVRSRKIRAVWTPPPKTAFRRTVLDLAARSSGVTNRAIVNELGVSPATAHRYLSALGDEGVIQMHGRTRAAVWRAVVDDAE